MNSERQPIAFIQNIQVFEADLFKRLRGEVVEVTFDSIVPNAVDVVVFKVGEVSISKRIPEAEEIIGQNIVAFGIIAFIFIGRISINFLR